jgi:hypothetical protein
MSSKEDIVSVIRDPIEAGSVCVDEFVSVGVPSVE